MNEAGDHDGDLHTKEARRRPWEEEGGILRLKKEANAARDLWDDKFVPGALDRWLELERKGARQAGGVARRSRRQEGGQEQVAEGSHRLHGRGSLYGVAGHL